MKYCAVVVILLTVLNTSVSAQDTVHVKAGWNIIGSVKAGAIPDVLSTKPDSIITGSFFGYSPGVGYQSTDTLDKGFGYWVKVKYDGIIVFKTTPFIDSCKSKAFIYQGKLYNTVKISDQCWMAENLDVGTMIDSLTAQSDNDILEKYCYSNDPLNCTLYGGLYLWDETMQYVTTEGAQGICPPGWHVPTYAEFQTMATAIGNDGNGLKALGQGAGGGAGTNTSGFSALLGGFRSYFDFGDGLFGGLDLSSTFWSSAFYHVGFANRLDLYFGNGSLVISDGYTTSGFSVRCIAD